MRHSNRGRKRHVLAWLQGLEQLHITSTRTAAALEVAKMALPAEAASQERKGDDSGGARVLGSMLGSGTLATAAPQNVLWACYASHTSGSLKSDSLPPGFLSLTFMHSLNSCQRGCSHVHNC